jgi:beta-N-acetylglucosaminidase
LVTTHKTYKVSNNTIGSIIKIESTKTEEFIANSEKVKIEEIYFEIEKETALASSRNTSAIIKEEHEEEKNRVENIFTLNPFGKTNLTAKRFDNLLKNTGLTNNGESYRILEEKFNINGVYAISVAMLESGRGYKLANKHNY